VGRRVPLVSVLALLVTLGVLIVTLFLNENVQTEQVSIQFRAISSHR
jgi:hypothetical protein